MSQQTSPPLDASLDLDPSTYTSAPYSLDLVVPAFNGDKWLELEKGFPTVTSITEAFVDFDLRIDQWDPNDYAEFANVRISNGTLASPSTDSTGRTCHSTRCSAARSPPFRCRSTAIRPSPGRCNLRCSWASRTSAGACPKSACRRRTGTFTSTT